MDTRNLARYAALPDANTAPTLEALEARHGGLLEMSAARAETSTWGLVGANYVVATLLKLLAQSMLREDEASRKLAGAQMKVGRLEKRLNAPEPLSQALNEGDGVYRP